MADNRSEQRIILFYKYHPLSPDFNITEAYRASLECLCKSLFLKGRILVGASETEGINGTLAGSEPCVRAFTLALLKSSGTILQSLDPEHVEVIKKFWEESARFFERIGHSELRMDSAEDFKWSSSTRDEELFPDLNIKLVKELIGTGGALSKITLDETAKDYLTPKQWSQAMGAASKDNDTVIIDCRNTKEYEIGHFDDALNPKTTTFGQFPTWVDQHETILADKKVLMYCTGGIRCEKASAYIRKQVPSVREVKHLKGGIHKYLEEFGERDESHWKGKNFVFDGRQAASAGETISGRDANNNLNNAVDGSGLSAIIGHCLYCSCPYDQFEADCVCTVCREPVLACPGCKQDLSEYHCRDHFHLKDCYFSCLEPFTQEELRAQHGVLLSNLKAIAVGRRYKQKRKTLQKQILRVMRKLQEEDGGNADNIPSSTACRNCSKMDCQGRCWGFYGLQRKKTLDSERVNKEARPSQKMEFMTALAQSVIREGSISNENKEIVELGLWKPSAEFRDVRTGVRMPPCVIRRVKCSVKAKWSGRSVLDMVRTEFSELSAPKTLTAVVHHGLLCINGVPVTPVSAPDTRLKTSDVVSRTLHWHEAPVIVPEIIKVDRIKLPEPVRADFDLSGDGDVFVCSKPSTVPVHAAGPYFANCLTTMIEAQEKLKPGSLKPIHRIDRVTSGLTLCCTDSATARIFQRSLVEGAVEKCYIARVHGQFPSTKDSAQGATPLGRTKWVGEGYLEIDAPVRTTDPANGVRAVDKEGKSSRSIFRCLSYSPDVNQSTIVCYPVTGRSHQLRVHLQWIGFPIVGDVLYDGKELGSTHPRLEIIQGLEEASRQPPSESSEWNDVVKACRCCQDGIDSSFTDAQLLLKGHQINLHALKYRIKIFPKGKKRKLAAKGEEKQVAVDFQVEGPCWMDDSSIISALPWPSCLEDL